MTVESSSSSRSTDSVGEMTLINSFAVEFGIIRAHLACARGNPLIPWDQYDGKRTLEIMKGLIWAEAYSGLERSHDP